MKIGKGSVAALAMVLVSNGALAAPGCVEFPNTPEFDPAYVAIFQMQMTVAALSCDGEVANFNAFETRYKTELVAEDARLHEIFTRKYGAGQAQSEYEAYKSRIIEHESELFVGATSCNLADAVFKVALAADKPKWEVLVDDIRISVVNRLPEACELK